MNGTWKQGLLEHLHQRRILDQAAMQRLARHDRVPWFVVLLVGLAAWLAAALLIGSTLVALLGDSPATAAAAGALLLGAAIWLLRRSGVFAGQLGLALSLAGQGMLVLAVAQLDALQTWQHRPPALAAMLLASGMLWTPAAGSHRLVCALIALAAGAALVGLNPGLACYGLLLAVAATWIWWQRRRWAGSRRAALYRAAGGGATLLALGLPLIAQRHWMESFGMLVDQRMAFVLSWLYPLGAGALLLGITLRLSRGLSAPMRIAAVAAVLLLGGLGLQAPGLLIAAALWLALFHACERFWAVLVGLGALLYLGDFYYGLHISLLHKSLLLVISGLLLLGLRGYLLRQWEGENEH